MAENNDKPDNSNSDLASAVSLKPSPQDGNDEKILRIEKIDGDLFEDFSIDDSWMVAGATGTGGGSQSGNSSSSAATGGCASGCSGGPGK